MLATAAGAVVAIIDDHDVVHAGVAAWCADAPSPVRLGGAFSSLGAFLARSPTVLPTSFDVVILDPQFDGKKPDFGALRTLCTRSERVIVFSDLSADEVILTC